LFHFFVTPDRLGTCRTDDVVFIITPRCFL
jgi:hypothetical protein